MLRALHQLGELCVLPSRSAEVLRVMQGPDLPLSIDFQLLADFCARHRVRSMRLFGSVLRDDFDESSDVDVLLEFEPGVNPDLFELGEMQQALSELFGRVVDLKTPEMLSPDGLARIVSTSRLAYAA